MSTETLPPENAEVIDFSARNAAMAAKFTAAQSDDTTLIVPKTADKKADAPKGAVDSLLGEQFKKTEKEAQAENPLEEFKDPRTVNVVKMRGVLEKTHAELAEARKEVERLKSEYAPKSEQNASKEQLAALQKERDELSGLLKIQNPKRDPEYKKIVDGKKFIVEKMSKRVEDFGGKPDAIREALEMKGKAKTAAIKEALSDLDAEDRGPIYALITRFEELEDSEHQFLEEADKNWETRAKEDETKTRSQREQEVALLHSEFDEVAQVVPKEFFMLREADPSATDGTQWNSEVKAARELARKVLAGEVPRKDSAAIIMKGVRADALQALYMAERTARVAAEKKAAGYEQAGPNFNGSRTPARKEAGDEPAGTRLARRFNEALQGGTTLAD